MQQQDFGALRRDVKEFVPASRSATAPPPSSLSVASREFVPPAPPQPQAQPAYRVFVPGQGLTVAAEDEDEDEAEEEPSASPLTTADFAMPRLQPRAMEPMPPRRTARSTLLPDNLRAYFAQQARILYASQPPDDPAIKELPRKFHSFMSLDDPKSRALSGSLGYPSAVFKAVDSKEGYVVAVRRIDNTRPNPALGMVASLWARVSNPSVLPLREVFVQNRALFVVHDFLPGAQTVKEFIASRGPAQLLPESALWSIATQLLLAVRAVHAANLGGAVLGPTKVLLTGRHRARLASAGLLHALEPVTSVASLQQEDILWVGKLVVMLATMNLGALANLPVSVERMQQVYSAELVTFALHPFTRQLEHKQCNVYDLLAQASQGLLAENDALYAHGDALEEVLSRTYEADRLFRLTTKIQIVTERPPLPGQKVNDSWSETDQRYVVKLFRDYVFHQVDDNERPWMDLGHIVDCLNKLDVGSLERILLASRDGKSFLVVTYDEVRMCLERSFQELLMSNAAHTHPSTMM